MPPKEISTVKIFHNKKSHDFDSHECGGAKVKGVEETVGVEADSVNSMGWISSAAPGTWELCKVCTQSVTHTQWHQVSKLEQDSCHRSCLFCSLNYCNSTTECESWLHQNAKRNAWRDTWTCMSNWGTAQKLWYNKYPIYPVKSWQSTCQEHAGAA